MTDREYQLRYERTGFDPDGIYTTQPCNKAGHVFGCPGLAGGDHELQEGWIEIEQPDGTVIEIEVAA